MRTFADMFGSDEGDVAFAMWQWPPLRAAFARRVMDQAAARGARVVAELFQANPYMTDGSFCIWDALAAQPAAGYPIGAFSPACIEVEESEGPESGFTRPTCDTPNVQYL